MVIPFLAAVRHSQTLEVGIDRVVNRVPVAERLRQDVAAVGKRLEAPGGGSKGVVVLTNKQIGSFAHGCARRQGHIDIIGPGQLHGAVVSGKLIPGRQADNQVQILLLEPIAHGAWIRSTMAGV